MLLRSNVRYYTSRKFHGKVSINYQDTNENWKGEMITRMHSRRDMQWRVKEWMADLYASEVILSGAKI
jgi:hypothetical protein